ncbi:MAG: hypothetical protein AAGG01_12560, partial [Planctomycetota bacterium]
MLFPLLTLACAPVQGCAFDLPFSASPFDKVGRLLDASDALVLATRNFNDSLLIWRRAVGASAAFEAELTPGSAERITSFDASGDRIAVHDASAGSQNLRIWELDASGAWQEGPSLVPATGTRNAGFVRIDGDTAVASNRQGSSGPSGITIWDRDPATGSWIVSQNLVDTSLGNLTLRDFEGDCIVATAGFSSSSRVARIYERTGGVFTLTESLEATGTDIDLETTGNRIALHRRSFSPMTSIVEIWASGPTGWELTQEIAAPAPLQSEHVAFSDRWLAVGSNGFSFSQPTPRPVRVFRREGNSEVWFEVESATPPDGLESSTDTWGTQLALAGDELFSADDRALANGRIVEVDLGCLSAVPPLHWVDAELVVPERSGWPAAEERLQLSLDLPFATGRPYGLRSASTSVIVDYLLDITGVPCSSDYSTSICSFGAYTIRDGASAANTAPFPIDPSGGVPQLYSTEAGPMFSATSSSTIEAWPFRFQGTEINVPPFAPTGQPMDLRFQGQSYNCVDFVGTWYPEIPHVTGHCFLEVLPTTVRSLTFQATVTGEVALELPPLGPGLQGTVCAGGLSGAGVEAALEAVGSSSVADDALFVQVSGIAPESPG